MGASYNMPKSRLPFQFNTLAYDTHAAATYGSGVTFTYFIPISGYYAYSIWMETSNNQLLPGAGDIGTITAFLNGTSFIGNVVTHQRAPGSGGLSTIASLGGIGQGYFSAGDKLVFVGDTDGASYSITPNTTLNYVAIERMSGPAQIQAADNPNASYSTNAGQSISNAATPIIDFEDVTYDTFGLVTTGASWKFTCNRAGKVKVQAMITYASGVFTINTNVKLYCYKNGALYRKLDEDTIMATITDDFSLTGSTDMSVIAGDTIDFRTDHGESAARALTATTSENYCSLAYWPGF